MKADITSRNAIDQLLNALIEDTAPKWGVMKPQNMVEHLALIIEHTNGKRIATQRTTEQEAKAAKEIIIYSDAEIPHGLKSPLAGEDADPFRFASLTEAKQDLNKQLDDFETYFKNNPSATPVQPRFGPLNYQEWIILHNKHFTHHFKQFDLL